MPAPDDDPRCVGPVVALTNRVTVDVPARFKNSKAVGAVFGPIPATSCSGAIQPLLETKWKSAHFALPCQSVVGILSRTALPLLRQHEGRHRDPHRIDKHVSRGRLAGALRRSQWVKFYKDWTVGICFGRRVYSESAAEVLVGAIRLLHDPNCQLSDRANTECVHLTKDWRPRTAQGLRRRNNCFQFTFSL